MAVFQSSTSLLAMALVVSPICLDVWLSFGLVLGPLPSSPPYWKRFVFKSKTSSSSLVPTKGEKSMTLKVSCTPHSIGKSNL